MAYLRRTDPIDEIHDERRVDILNSHEIRLAILESSHKEAVDARHAHSRAIDELNRNLHDTASALREGLASFNSKFDGLICSIKLGFYIISLACTIFIFMVGAFLAYNEDLDEKYLSHSKELTQQIEKIK